MGIRLDDGPGVPGAYITPHYDSLLVKVTAHARNRLECILKLRRALKEFRVRGVSTNTPFLLGVLDHKDFTEGTVNTSFIAGMCIALLSSLSFKILNPENNNNPAVKLLIIVEIYQ